MDQGTGRSVGQWFAVFNTRWSEQLRSGQPSPETDAGDLLALLDVHLRAQATLCSDLEAVADSLPDNVNRQWCLELARRLPVVVRNAHKCEEQQLFRAMTERSTQINRATLERLRFEHWEDEIYADELSDALVEYVTGQPRPGAEALAYMLRGFFEGLRRHVAFEAEHIRPMLANMGRD